MTEELAKADEKDIAKPFPVESVPWVEFSKGRFTSRSRDLGRHGGGLHLGVILEELPPGKQSCPFHYHLLEEEHVYMLEGAITLRLGGETHIMESGDYVCFPAGQKAGHCLINHTDKTARYLIVGEDNPAEVAIFPESGRFSVRALGQGFRQSATMEYWEGETTD